MMRESKTAPLWPLALVMLVYPYFFERAREGFLAEETAHVYLTRALVDGFTVRINEQIKRFGDIPAKSVFEGDQFAAVAPGLAVLAVVPYAMQKLVYSVAGSEPSIAASMRWLRLVLVTLPTALFLFWLYGFLVGRGVRAHPARFAVIALALCLPFWLQALSLSAALLAGMFLFIGMMMLTDDKGWPSPLMFSVAGILCGLAAFLSYTLLPAVLVVGFLAFSRARNPRWLAYFAVPVALAVGAVAAYHYVCFGQPLFVPGRAGVDAGTHLWGLASPSWAGIARMLWGAKGIAVLAPILLLVPVGFFGMLAAGEILQAALCGFVVLLQILWVSADALDPSSLGNPGIVLALVFCAWPFARAVETLTSVAGGPFLAGVLGVWSTAEAALAIATCPYFPDGYRNGLRDLAFVLLRDGMFMQNIGHALALRGTYALVPAALLLIAIAAALALGGVPASESSGWRRVSAVFLLATAALWWQLSWRADHGDPRKRYRDVLAIERALAMQSRSESALRLRAERVEASQGAASREALLLRGQAFTAEGDNATALDAYRRVYGR